MEKGLILALILAWIVGGIAIFLAYLEGKKKKKTI